MTTVGSEGIGEMTEGEATEGEATEDEATRASALGAGVTTAGDGDGADCGRPMPNTPAQNNIGSRDPRRGCRTPAMVKTERELHRPAEPREEGLNPLHQQARDVPTPEPVVTCAGEPASR